jgi:predicted oxidoreductase
MMKVSKIISGTMNWGVWGNNLNTLEMASLIETGLSLGINTFDHADIYGDYTTETAFGKAYAQTKIAREELFFISKCGIQCPSEFNPKLLNYYSYSKSYIINQVERSLLNLKTDYLDLLLLHRPSPLMQGDEINSAIDQLKAEGKIKNYGVSNFTPSQIDLIQETTPILFNQIECSLTHYQPMFDDTLDHMINKNIQTMAWAPLGNYFKEKDEAQQRIENALKPLLKKYDADEDELILAWLMRHPASIHPVIGTTKVERIKKSLRAADIVLDEIDWFSLLVASQGHRMP